MLNTNSTRASDCILLQSNNCNSEPFVQSVFLQKRNQFSCKINKLTGDSSGFERNDSNLLHNTNSNRSGDNSSSGGGAATAHLSTAAANGGDSSGENSLLNAPITINESIQSINYQSQNCRYCLV